MCKQQSEGQGEGCRWNALSFAANISVFALSLAVQISIVPCLHVLCNVRLRFGENLCVCVFMWFGDRICARVCACVYVQLLAVYWMWAVSQRGRMIHAMRECFFSCALLYSIPRIVVQISCVCVSACV